MEETIRKLEKIIENPRRADKIVYTRGDIEDAIEWINRLKDRIKELEEENKKLRWLQIAWRTVEQWLEEGKKVMIATDDWECITLLDFINLGWTT